MRRLSELEPCAQAILAREREVYAARNPRSRAAFERSCRVLPGGVTRTLCHFPPFPCQSERGEGCWLVDLDGNRRLDLFNCATTLILGHCPPEVLRAVEGQLGRGTAFQTNTGLETLLAEMLVSRVASVEQLRFTNSGSEGTLMAVRAARTFTGRPKLAKIEGGYHGSHDSVEISVRPGGSAGGAADAPMAVAGSAGILPEVVGSTVILPYNNLGAAQAILAREASQIAAIIVEPVLAGIGFVPAEPEFLVGLREEARRYGMLFILDEVQSFRLDRGGAQRLFGITPDLTCFGKIIGGGFPVGAFGGRADLMALFDTTAGRGKIPHAGTFNGNPITMAAGIATLERLTEPAYEKLNGAGDRLRARLRALGGQYGVPLQATGIGSLWKIHFAETGIRDYRDALKASAPLHEALFLYGLNRGLFIGPAGRDCLSLPMGEAEIESYLGVVEAFLQALCA